MTFDKGDDDMRVPATWIATDPKQVRMWNICDVLVSASKARQEATPEQRIRLSRIMFKSRLQNVGRFNPEDVLAQINSIMGWEPSEYEMQGPNDPEVQMPRIV